MSHFSPPLMPLYEENNTKEVFAVSDIESRDWIKFLVIGYYTKAKGAGLKFFEDLTDYMEWCFAPEQPCDIMYCHFGGRFDFLFLLKEFFDHDDVLIEGMIPRGSSLLCFNASWVEYSEDGLDLEGIKIKKKNIVEVFDGGGMRYRARTIKFFDSAAMLPFGLRSLCENFKVDHLKLDIDYDTIKKVTPKLLKYLEHDLKGHYEVLEKYQEWPLISKVGVSHTMASQSMKVFRTFLKEPIKSLKGHADRFVRSAYFGGRTEIFRPLFTGDKNNLLSCLDVNSLYPTVMQLNEFPTDYVGSTQTYQPELMGFYEAEVEVPDGMYIPPLGTIAVDGENGPTFFDQRSATSKLIFPSGRFYGRFSTIELEYARSLGVKIKWTGEGHIFKNGGFIFRDFIDELYKIRENSSRDSVDNVLAKLLMNSCYGKFALNLDRESVVVDDGRLGVKDIIAEIETKSGTIRLCTEDKRLDTSFANAAVAAWVTSLARIHMHKTCLLPGQASVHYTDTDSAFVKNDKKLFSIGEKLGDLKLEYLCDSACFLLPKTYMAHSFDDIFKYMNEKGKSVKTNRKIVMKGFDKKKIQHFEMEDFMNALEGEFRIIKEKIKNLDEDGKEIPLLQAKQSAKVATFKTAIKKNNLLMMLEEGTRGIRSVYDKRKIIKSSGKFDTEPLVIRDNRIINL